MRRFKDTAGVDPVIATLVLVLIAVAAGVALYVWQAGWAEDITDGITTTDISESTDREITVMGSTTVEPLAQEAAAQFMVANPEYNVYVSSGGSGAGIDSAGTGFCDLGMASKPLSDDNKAEYPTLIQHEVAIDAIVMITSATNTQGVTSLEAIDVAAIYYANAGATPSDAAIVAHIAALDTLDTTGAANPDGLISWSEIGGTSNAMINTYERTEESGTEGSFVKLFGLASKDKQLANYGITATYGYTSNGEVLNGLAADDLGLSFMSYGYAAADDGVSIVEIDWDGDATVQADEEATVNNIKAGTYEGARSLYVLTLGTPEEGSLLEMFLDYMLTPEYNQGFAAASGYISVF
jgi:phosphate transport system substrate-binding protein